MIKPMGSVAVAAWPCEAVVEHAYEYLDGELPADADALIREHLALCPPCAAAMAREHAFLTFLERRLRIEPAPRALRARVVAELAHEDASSYPR
jgi:mycothiol system anti-sigma-R factor